MPSGNCQITGRFYASLDEHHIVPREYGGETGPTIMLGPDIHQIIHRASKSLTIKEQFLSSLPMNQRQKANTLINCIQMAGKLRKRTSTRKISFDIDEKTYQKLKDLGKI